MNIKAFLFDDDRGVSPVIGVILMVAITVILAAVIAAFVLGLGDTNSTAPSVTWEYDYDESAGKVTVTNTGGESFDPARVELQFDNLDDGDDSNDREPLVSVPLDANERGSSPNPNANVTSTNIDNPSTAGDSITIDLTGTDASTDPADANAGADGAAGTTNFELRIIFTSEDGGTSSEIGGTTGPDA